MSVCRRANAISAGHCDAEGREFYRAAVVAVLKYSLNSDIFNLLEEFSFTHLDSQWIASFTISPALGQPARPPA